MTTDRPPAPADPPDERSLERPLTFFLTARDRAAVLRRLRATGPDRARALLDALGLRTTGRGRERRP